MSNITMNVEMLPGTSIADAVEESKNLAIKLDIAYVQFNFNGVSFSVGQSANADNAYDKFCKAMDKGNKFVIENGNK